MPKYYTPKEANETLIIIRPMVVEMMKISERVRAHQPEYWQMMQKSAGNGGNPELSRLLPEFDRLDVLVHQVQDMGIEIKDLTTGLIDFFAIYEGREVYLCWKFDEEAVQYWHELNGGFQGRKFIDWE